MHLVDSIAPLGMDVELSNNIDAEHFDYEDSFDPALENFNFACNSGGKIPLHHSIHSRAKEIAKYEDHVTDEMKDYIDTTLNSLLGAVVNNIKKRLMMEMQIKIKHFTINWSN